jgi:hypothetical protein
MDRGKIINNGNEGVPGGGVFNADWSNTTFDKTVTISKNSVAVWSRNGAYGPITLGAKFENGSGEDIVIDAIATTTAATTTAANIIGWWGTNRCLIGDGATTENIDEFTPGVIARGIYSGGGVMQLYPNKFTIAADGKLAIQP